MVIKLLINAKHWQRVNIGVFKKVVWGANLIKTCSACNISFFFGSDFSSSSYVDADQEYIHLVRSATPSIPVTSIFDWYKLIRLFSNVSQLYEGLL